jgi:carboxylesterase type B
MPKESPSWESSNIDHLVTMPTGESLFSQVTHQSDGSFMTNCSDKETLLKLDSEFLGKSIGDENENTLSKIRQLPAKTLIAAAKAIYNGCYFDSVVDGMSVMEPIVNTIKFGKMHRVDLLIGFNDDWILMTTLTLKAS